MLTANKIRLIYLFVYMSWAVWKVFYNIFLEKEGLSGTQIGTLNAIMQSTIFVVALWGIIADKRGVRPTMRIVVMVATFALYFLGYITSFWALVFYIPLLTVFTHPVGPLTDALAVQYSEIEKKHSYGEFRLWGSLGWAVAALIGGMLFSHISVDYTFVGTAGLLLFVLPLLATRNKKRTYTANIEPVGLKKLMKNRPLVLFVGVLTIYGVTCSPVNSYLNLYFIHLDAGNNIVGWAYAIMALSELPFFFLGNKMIKKFGAKNVLLFAMVTMLIRFLFYGLMPGVGLALVVGALQGVSLAFFLVGAVEYMKKLMPEGQHATAQSLIWAGYVGLGQTIGNLLIGYLIDKSGMVGVMQVFIGVSAVCVVLTALYFRKANAGTGC